MPARTWSRLASASSTNTTPTRRSIAVPLVSVNDDVAEQHKRREMLVCNLTERLLSLGCIDAGESDDVLDVFSVQNVDRVFG